ncbi:MAG: hypothetical protein ACRDYW_03145 [Acidimicrobiales bacterium]
MDRPVILVLVEPYVFASVIVDVLRARDRYDVVAPDLRTEERPSGHFAGAITSLPVSAELADVVVELPDSFEKPLRITTGDRVVLVAVRIDRPIEDAVDALDQLVFGPSSGCTRE